MLVALSVINTTSQSCRLRMRQKHPPLQLPPDASANQALPMMNLGILKQNKQSKIQHHNVAQTALAT